MVISLGRKRRRERKERLLLSPTKSFELQKLREEERQDRQERELALRRFRQTRTGRAGEFLGSLTRRRFVRPVRGIRTGRVGRPRGSYDPRYAAYGGVYGYRKQLSLQLRARRLQLLRDNTLSPQQQNILRQIDERDRMRQMNPENRAIPDTTGRFDFANIEQEISDASRLVR